MHQYKTVAQSLLILSIFNLVLTAPVQPVVRNIYDARDPVTAKAVRNVMSKERHQSRSGGALASASSPPPDGSTAPSPPPLDESTTLPSFPPQPDGLTTSHSLPPFQDGPPRLSTSSHPDSEWSLQEIPTHPDEPPVSSLPSVPTMDNIGTNPTLRELVRDMVQQRQHSEALEQSANNGNSVAKKTVAGFLVLAVAGSWLTYYFRHRKHQHRTIDPDCATVKGSAPDPGLDN